MPLENHEWDVVRYLIRDHLVGTDNPYNQLKLYFPADAVGWSITSIASDNAQTVVRAAQNSSMADDEPLSIRLLERLTHLDEIRLTRPDDLRLLRTFLSRLRGEKAALDALDPYSDPVLSGTGEVFIDRMTVRKTLRQFVKPDPGLPEPMVLRVTGERASGKSYTYALIRHLAEHGGFAPARVILDRSTNAEDVLRDLAVRIATPGDEPNTVADPVKRLQYWANWLVSAARRSSPDRPWWFVLDQCNELDPGSDAVELIAQIALAIWDLSVPPGGRRPRLVLLGYGDNLSELPLPPKQIRPEMVTPLRDLDLRDFFTSVFQSRTTDEARLEELVGLAVQQVIRDAEEATLQGGSYMHAISVSAGEALDVYNR